jgi:hypothetical protein
VLSLLLTLTLLLIGPLPYILHLTTPLLLFIIRSLKSDRTLLLLSMPSS